jgi:hypothetical protein
MKRIIVMVALACLTSLPPVTSVAQPQPADCKPAHQSIVSLNYLSEPVVTAIDTKTGDANWERQRAIYERTLELSKIARHYEGNYKTSGYDLESRLIDAKYSVALAEVDQLADRNLQQADAKIKEARHDVRSALEEAKASEKPPIETLEGRLHRVKLVVTQCHGQSRGENRYQYEKLLSSFSRVIRAL